MEVNNLVYKQPTSLSLATSRKMCRQYFQRSNYSDGDTAICEFNTGSSYINPHNSYLTFKVSGSGSGAVGGVFGSGSAMNLLESLTIRSRSGTELDRIDHLNLYAKNNTQWSYAEDWIGHFGTMVGLTDSSNVSGTGVDGTAQRFLSLIHI